MSREQDETIEPSPCLLESIKKYQALQAQVSNILTNQHMTSDKRIVEAARWRAGQLTAEERQQLENAMSGNKKSSLEAIMQSGNLYVYGMNNPLMYKDPSGNIAITATAVTVIVIAGAKALGITVTAVAIIAAVEEFVNWAKKNRPIFYSVDGHAFGKMKQISIFDAVVRVLSGKNVYTPSQTAAAALARVASFGLNPVHDKLDYNAHYHLNGRRGTAHIFYGLVR